MDLGIANGRSLVDKLIAGNGIAYRGDIPCLKIIEYTNAWGGQCFRLVFEGEDPNGYQELKYVINPKVIWERS